MPKTYKFKSKNSNKIALLFFALFFIFCTTFLVSTAKRINVNNRAKYMAKFLIAVMCSLYWPIRNKDKKIKIAIFKYLVVFSFSWKNPFIPQLAPVQILTTHTCLLYSLLVLNFLYFLALNLSFLSCHFHQKF